MIALFIKNNVGSWKKSWNIQKETVGHSGSSDKMETIWILQKNSKYEQTMKISSISENYIDNKQDSILSCRTMILYHIPRKINIRTDILSREN